MTITNGHPDELSGAGRALDFSVMGTGQLRNIAVGPAGSNGPSFLQNFIAVSGTLDTATGDVQAAGMGQYRGFATDALLNGRKAEKSPGLVAFTGTYIIGKNGGLPGDLPIAWDVACDILIPATPTPADTPPPDDFSITVISLNVNTGAPIPGVQFELYASNNCEGAPIATGTADGSGIFDFVGIPPAVYYVKQITPPGYHEAAEGECQRVDAQQATRAGSQGLPACPIAPDAQFPAPGCDEFASGAQVNVEMVSGGSRFTVTLNGPTLIARHTSPAIPTATGVTRSRQSSWPCSSPATPSLARSRSSSLRRGPRRAISRRSKTVRPSAGLRPRQTESWISRRIASSTFLLRFKLM